MTASYSSFRSVSVGFGLLGFGIRFPVVGFIVVPITAALSQPKPDDASWALVHSLAVWQGRCSGGSLPFRRVKVVRLAMFQIVNTILQAGRRDFLFEIRQRDVKTS
jgi:hypothetical protein